MWLLDANMDVHLVKTLNELGVSCDTAANRGWKALSNGELVLRHGRKIHRTGFRYPGCVTADYFRGISIT
jgi:hypothetical protein